MTAIPAGGISQGRVVVNFGAYCLVEDNLGQLARCRCPRRLKRPVCGDHVYWQAMPGQDQGALTEILPRRNELLRHDPRTRNRVLAANLDVILIVIAAKPEPDLALADRYLVGAEVMRLQPVLVFNKSDLLDSATRDQWRRALREFETLGYAVIRTSTKTELGLDELRAILQDRSGIVVGQSGVGKSSLIDRLVPDLALRIQVLSEASGEGQHTTTATRLYPLPGRRGCVIDSPGVRDFRLWPMPATELAGGFPEIRKVSGLCRFQDCRHIKEPDCEVKRSVERDLVSPRRYASYCQLVEWAAQERRAY
ncbi:MAG: ribosome small subunit-dependent GTPase A [Nevskiales bacterium]